MTGGDAAAPARTAAPDDIVATAADVRPGAREPLVLLEPLRGFLDAHGLGHGEPRLAPLGDGRSNVTYALDRGGAPMVLRRPPRGPLAPSTHDVLREARILAALAGRVPVPRVLAVCEDPERIGAPFYVMERAEGEMAAAALPPALDDPAGRAAAAAAAVETLAALHAVDWRAAGLEGFGRPDGYLERQVKRFAGLWERHATRPLPAVDRTARWLAGHVPDASGPATIVHGDFRLGNLLLAATAPARVTAILDWEMSTLGDPLADLGYLCLFWTEADDPDDVMTRAYPLTRGRGFPSREELVARYAEASCREPGDIRFHRVLALWKLIVFMEGNYRRALAGSTDDPHLLAFGEGIAELADRAVAMTRA